LGELLPFEEDVSELLPGDGSSSGASSWVVSGSGSGSSVALVAPPWTLIFGIGWSSR
jgi:hypothetical protein